LEESGPAVVQGLGVKDYQQCLVGHLFSVLWKMIMERLDATESETITKANDDVTTDGKQTVGLVYFSTQECV
jgi:hypothetical protein